MHAHATLRGEPLPRFDLAQSAELGADLLLVHHSKSEVFVERTIPRDIRERRERDAGCPLS